MTKIRYKTIILFGLMLAGFFMVDFTSTHEPSKLGVNQGLIYSAEDNLDDSNWNVTIDKDEVFRAIESVSISFTDEDHNASEEITFHYKANITFSDGTEFNVTLANSTNEWSRTYTPTISTPAGRANLTIIKVINSTQAVENAGTLTLDAYFLIKNNKPDIGVQLNSTEVYREETINMTLTPFDVEDSMGALSWSVEVYASDGGLKDTIRFKSEAFPVLEYDYKIAADFTVGDYYINATCWDSEDNVTTVRYPITIMDHSPVIDDYVFEIDGEEQTGDITVLRGSDLLLKLNASDLDYNDVDGKLMMSIIATDPGTGMSLFPDNYKKIALNEAGWNFTKNITFAASFSVGYTLLNIKVYQEGNEHIFFEFTQAVNISNNAPEISRFAINGKSPSEQKTFTEGEQIIFTFNVTDVEDAIEYIKVDLHFTNSIGEPDILSYITPYKEDETSLTIRAIDLPMGTYDVYVTVYDALGASQKSPVAYSFDIVGEDVIQPITWLISIAAFILGGALALTISYSLIRSSAKIKPPRDVESSSDEDVMTESDEDIEEEEEETPKSVPKSKKKKLIRKL